MVGKEASPGEFDGTVGVILGMGGSKINAFAWSGMEGTEAIGKLGGKTSVESVGDVEHCGGGERRFKHIVRWMKQGCTHCE